MSRQGFSSKAERGIAAATACIRGPSGLTRFHLHSEVPCKCRPRTDPDNPLADRIALSARRPRQNGTPTCKVLPVSIKLMCESIVDSHSQVLLHSLSSTPSSVVVCSYCKNKPYIKSRYCRGVPGKPGLCRLQKAWTPAS